jgi:membrane-bound lytic murein transglycosylase B
MRRRRLLGLAAATSVVVAACGSDGSDVERSDATTEVTEPAEPSTTTTTEPDAAEMESENTTAAAAAVVPDATAEPAATPGELAERLTGAEDAVRDPATPADLLDRAAFEQQMLYRQLARMPDWEAEVATLLPEPYRAAAAANVAARREFRSMHRNLSDALPAWRIVEPPPADELLSYYQAAEAEFGVPWEILAAVNLVETGMGRIRGVSVAGAQGPMQFMPATWAAFGAGGDVNDPRDAVMGAARYLAHNGGGRGEIDNALWNYNHSDRYVRGVKHYASVMEQDPNAFRAYHQWEIVYLSTMGDVWLPVGYEAYERVPVAEHLQRNPAHHLGTETN